MRVKTVSCLCVRHVSHPYVSELKAAMDGNIAGLQRFNILEYMPQEIQTGGSVEGLDDCYMNEGSA